MAEKDTLLVAEQELHEQEQGIHEMEAQLHTQDQGVTQMERAFGKRNKTLLNLASFVSDQEGSLLKRAEAIGAKAKDLVTQMLAKGTAANADSTVSVGKVEDRTRLLEQRREILGVRMALIEEREAVYAARHEAIEVAEANIADLEKRLLQREREISEALRELISASTSLMEGDDGAGDDDEDADDDDEDEESRAVAPPPADEAEEASGEADAEAEGVRVDDHGVRKGEEIRGEAVEVASGSSASAKTIEGLSPNSRTEDKVTRRRKGRARARTNQFRITLEAQMAAEEPHAFFSYRDDGPDDLPGLFIATPNLLKVGREVRVRVTLGKTLLEATGVVAWRRQRGEEGGPPGMGIELLNLNDGEQTAVEKWVKKHPPQMV